MQKLLQNKVALITGAGSGIGKSTASLFAQHGAKVAILSRSEHELNETAGLIKEVGGESLKLICDISQPTELEKAIQQIIEKYKQLNIVFANAGINGTWAPLDELKVEEWDQVMNINLRGTFLTLKYTVPYLQKAGGAILITSSINGTRVFSNAGSTAYACTKAAQVALTKMTALELAKFKIRVNAICPGAIETKIKETMQPRNLEKAAEKVEYPDGKIPLTDGQAGKAEDIAQLALFLASDAAKHITGTEVYIDGAESLLM